ncbi:unnamed protein product (macronuclear) [Paramecium tetraurelia]|uniref:VLIG-type G domain-containing protein n=1 Tax=Paramecium tetraurelia TaxID=5888 RepID=A0D3Q1_PARTE|nr:uncharacterized protein GSPATT00013156001 [Paramecium tetraurelia]CAK77668.1 unnamed protein product [Paramecium tetraurelia]|eukprot:XP_001445065.1 hypothetical protein (macronuclear) [Paramecium tetraurelia strain d4-2]
MFWRELIAINQRSNANTIIDPTDKVYEMIKKGEPFEFLDGDSLQINERFLESLKSKFTGLGNERVLVLSVLGPQSSGKSTILNKIFGCHFWTSVGRCTKGIYLNLLKIQFKEYFHNLFDYILILDSEGLQNPNQVDPEFDKKIALFVLAISDIILINVKGDIHQQFRNLVEMCIFTLVSLKTNLSSIKQLTWCFNQNNDANNFAPFLNQIQGIASSLNTEYNGEGEEKNATIDYNEFLNISKENIQILGFACIERLWRQNEGLGIPKDWRQLIINETFSEEAYIFGIRMIKNFIQKFQSQAADTSQMQSLSLFIQNINTNWQSICNLPDLLEFAELMQYKQDQQMKKYFEQILSSEKNKFSFLDEIGRDIVDQIHNNPAKNLAEFDKISNDKNQDLINKLNQNEKVIQEKLLEFKQNQKISKKIYLKYMRQLNQHINSLIKTSEVTLFEEIKNRETEYQNKRGFKSLDEYILGVSSDPKKLAILKVNEAQIIQAFNALWDQIRNEQWQKQGEIIREYSIKQFQCISTSFNEYLLKTENEKNYISSFLQNINNNSPFRQDFDERGQIYNIFEQELKKQNQTQFRTIPLLKEKMRYERIFNYNLEQRMKKQKTKYDVMDINNFYQFEIKIDFIEKNSLFDYLKSKNGKAKILEDLEQIFQNAEQNEINKQKHHNQQGDQLIQKAQYIISQVQNLLQFLDFFDCKYDNQLKIVVENTIKDKDKIWFWQNYNEIVIKSVKQLLASVQTIANKNVQSLMNSKINFVKHLQESNQGLNLKSVERICRIEKEVEEFISNFQHLIINIEKKIIPQQKYKMLEDSLQYIQKKGAYDQHFKQYFVHDFQKIMFEENQLNLQKENCQRNGFSKFQHLNSWQMMYFSIYELIKSEMRKPHQKVKNKKEDSDSEEIAEQNISLIKYIMSKIELEINEYNNSLANFGIILTGIGERYSPAIKNQIKV